MRIAHMVGPGLAPALLVVALAGGCGSGHRPSGQVVPAGQGGLGATISGEGVLPGEQRPADGSPPLTTTTIQAPIGRTSSPVVRSTVPVTRPPLQLGAVATTSTSGATTTTTTVATPTTAAGAGAAGAGSESGTFPTDQSAPTTTTTAPGVLDRTAPPRS